MKDFGVLYPKDALHSQTGEPIDAQHRPIFFLNQWDPKHAGTDFSFAKSDDQYTVAREIENWIRDAQSSGSSTVVISSEHFEEISDSGWQQFYASLEEAESQTSCQFETIDLYWVDRSFESRSESLFSEAIKHGSKLDEEEARPLFLALEVESKQRLRSLTETLSTRFQFTILDDIFETSEVSMQGRDVNRLSIFFEHIFRSELVETLDLTTEVLNPRWPSAMTEELLAFNLANTPDGLDPIRPFYRTGLNFEQGQAFERLDRFRYELMLSHQARMDLMFRDEEIARLRSDLVDAGIESGQVARTVRELRNTILEMEQSRSWRLTHPLRRLSDTIRRR